MNSNRLELYQLSIGRRRKLIRACDRYGDVSSSLRVLQHMQTLPSANQTREDAHRSTYLSPFVQLIENPDQVSLHKISPLQS
jgi:hypothetical protein